MPVKNMRLLNAKVFTRKRVAMGILVCILVLPPALSTGRMESAIIFLTFLLIITGGLHLMKRFAERP